MGNHELGSRIGTTVQVVYERRKPGETAIEILDRYCKGHGGDAEWEAEDPDRPGHVHPEFSDYTDPHCKAGLGMLMVEAFSPNGLADLDLYHGELGYKPTGMTRIDKELQRLADISSELWWAQVYRPFADRYGFW